MRSGLMLYADTISPRTRTLVVTTAPFAMRDDCAVAPLVFGLTEATSNAGACCAAAAIVATTMTIDVYRPQPLQNGWTSDEAGSRCGARLRGGIFPPWFNREATECRARRNSVSLQAGS